ncbi:MAG: GNAT family N-acetyltransferase [Acidimicrobiales bacterium]
METSITPETRPTLPDLHLSGENVRLRPLAPDDNTALAATGLPVADPSSGDRRSSAAYIEAALEERRLGCRIPLAIEWHGLVWGGSELAPRREWLFVGTSSFFVPPRAPDAGDTWEIGATWVAPSVCHSRCLTECRLLMLAYAFEQSVTKVVVGSAEAGPLAVVEADEWPAIRRQLRSQLSSPVRRNDSAW